jgi:DNA-directed RNA polymerase subunit alpha
MDLDELKKMEKSLTLVVRHLHELIKTEEARKRVQDIKEPGDIQVLDAGLSARATHALLCSGVTTIKDLVAKSERELLRTKNLGRRTLRELKIRLESMGLHLRED